MNLYFKNINNKNLQYEDKIDEDLLLKENIDIEVFENVEEKDLRNSVYYLHLANDKIIFEKISYNKNSKDLYVYYDFRNDFKYKYIKFLGLKKIELLADHNLIYQVLGQDVLLDINTEAFRKVFSDEFNIFDNIDNSDTYVTYHVYIVKETDTIDTIMEKYNVKK